jgi:hypothetical protein
MTVQNCCRTTPFLLIYLLGVISQVACEFDDEGDHLGLMLTNTANEMITKHQEQRILVYHPRRGATQHYLIMMGKHYACPAYPCDAPFNEYQGGVLVHVEKGRSGTGSFGNVVSVPRRFSVDKQNRDTTILLRNKGSYVEIADVS